MCAGTDMASPTNTNTSGNTAKEPNVETTSKSAGSPHDSSNAGIADTTANLQPELKEGNSPPPKEPHLAVSAREIYKIPSYASWFTWENIHYTERRFLAEFFDGKSAAKTPKIYKDYRDFIINKYRENPLTKITFTQVRRMVVGDVNSVRRVFDFLENWGLINYQASSKQQVKTENGAAPSEKSSADKSSPATAVVTSPAKPVAPCDRPPSATSTVVDGSSLACRKDAFAKDKQTETKTQSERSKHLFCNNCRAECTNSRYDCLKDEISPKSEDEGLPEEPGSSPGTNDCSADKTSKQDRVKESPKMVMEKDSKDENSTEEGEPNDNKDKVLQKPDKLLPCPRCDSLGTKFCYYNNYNVNQPRYFCKDCQRYWTAGGTMRNVPVGAGRRKSKHLDSNSWHMMDSDGITTDRDDAPDATHHQASFVLCPKCYADGNYGLGMSASDFKRIDLKVETSQQGSDKWTDQETLLLLEAILLHNDDWKSVAQHVGTKSEAACVTRFIQLPFGEQYMSNVGTEGSDRRSSNIKRKSMTIKQVSSPKDSSTQNQQDVSSGDKHTTEDDVSGPPLKQRCLTPLADASNPIMAQVAFLSAMVGSHVAAAAAQAAVAALYEEDSSASQITSTEEANFAGGKNCTTASGLEGTRKDFELEASNKEITRGANENAKDDEPLPNGKDMDPATPEMRSATATALGAAAVHARLLADQEDRDIEHIFSTIVDTQMKKLHDKIQHFEELELIMEKERSQVEQIKELLFADWVRFIQQSMNSGFSGSQQKELD